MAAADFTLNNNDLEQAKMLDKLKGWMKREGSVVDIEGIEPASPGEWLLLTVDCAPKVKADRAHWIVEPTAPGGKGELFGLDKNAESSPTEKIADGIVAMKALIQGRIWKAGTNGEDPNFLDDLELYHYHNKKKPKNKKGVPPVMICLAEGQIMMAHMMDMAFVTPRVRMQYSRNLEGLKRALGIKAKNILKFDSIQDLNAAAVVKKAEENNPKT